MSRCINLNQTGTMLVTNQYTTLNQTGTMLVTNLYTTLNHTGTILKTFLEMNFFSLTTCTKLETLILRPNYISLTYRENHLSLPPHYKVLITRS